MKKFYIQIVILFRTFLSKVKDKRWISMQELVSSISIYEKCIDNRWKQMFEIINKYEKGEFKDEKQFVEVFKKQYAEIQVYEDELVMMKIIQLRKNAGALFNSKSNMRICKRSVYKKRLKSLKGLYETMQHYSDELVTFIAEEIKEYDRKVNNLTVIMNEFNNKCVTMPFVLSLTPDVAAA